MDEVISVMEAINEKKLNIRYFSSRSIRCIAIICLGFLLTSTGWLAWEYHLMEQVSMVTSDVMAMVVGYMLQAVGIGIFALIMKHRANIAEQIMIVSLVAHIVCMIPAVLSPYVAGTCVFGLLMNVLCGMIAGYYLYELTNKMDGRHRAAAFGVGYGLAIVAAWILSRIDGGSIYYTNYVLVICAILTAITMAVVKVKAGDGEEAETLEDVLEEDHNNERGIKINVWLICVLVLLFGIVNSSAFAFPASDVGRYVNVELSRLIYAAGLIIAGFVTDKSRKYGALMAMAALTLPLVTLALRGEAVSTVTFWIIGYVAFGFYAVYRVVLLSDVACNTNRELMYMSGFGLLFGRVGDAIGEILCIALGDRTVIIVAVVAVLFVVTLIVFFEIYSTLYVREVKQSTEKEKFYQFSSYYDLSSREREVLHLLLEEKTNAEISDTLSVSERTVKFHVTNLLKKTGLKSRNDLIIVYNSYYI